MTGPTSPLPLRDLLPQLVGPGAFFMTGEDQLALATYNSLAGVVVTFVGRFLTLDGAIVPFMSTQAPNVDRTVKTIKLPLGEGWLLNVGAFVSTGAPLIGQTFARVTVERGATGASVELATLLAGYISAANRVAWPGSPLQASVDGPGVNRVVTVAAPAVATDIVTTVPAGARWRVLSIGAQLTTDANAGNRFFRIVIDEGSGVPFIITWNDTAVTASKLGELCAGQHASVYAFAGPFYRHLPLPETVLPAGSRIQILADNKQAGDQFSDAKILIQEWIDA